MTPWEPVRHHVSFFTPLLYLSGVSRGGLWRDFGPPFGSPGVSQGVFFGSFFPQPTPPLPVVENWVRFSLILSIWGLFLPKLY